MTIDDEPLMSIEQMNARLAELGYAPRVMNIPNKTNKVYRLSEEAEQGLVRIAEAHHFFWGSKVSVSAFLEALGQGMFDVTLKSFNQEKSSTE